MDIPESTTSLTITLSWSMRNQVMQRAMAESTSASSIIHDALVQYFAGADARENRSRPLAQRLDSRTPLMNRERYLPIPITDEMEKVYIIRAGTTCYLKIGRSYNPVNRMRTLQHNNMHILRLLYILKTPYARALESILHDRLWLFHVYGEWFLLPDNMLSMFIGLIEQEPAIHICPFRHDVFS